ncbi:MAG: PAS domain S-box protein [Magnetospirillum sp.]|nr:PAS domain S-box protein [Magnetospirillum sp.]
MPSQIVTRLPSLQRRLMAFAIALALLVLAALGALLVSGAATHGAIQDSRTQTVPQILERQRATANLERLIRFGWIAATAHAPQDWRQSAITAQALAFHPSLAFDDELRRQVIQVHSTIRQVITLREQAQELRNSGQAKRADIVDDEARQLWTPQESVLAKLQGRLADDAASLIVTRMDRISRISNLTLQSALAATLVILVIVGATAWMVGRNLLRPVVSLAQAMRDTWQGGEAPALPQPATAEIAVLQDAVGQLHDALHRANLREHALRASEQRLASIFSASEAAIVLTDSIGQVMQANDAFLRLLGLNDTLDLKLDRLTHPDDRGQAAETHQAMMSGEIDRHRADRRLVRADCTVVWVDATIRAIRDGTAPPHQFVAVAIDISDRVRAEKELLFIRALVDQSADPIYCLDPLDGGRMAWANAATCRHFGVSEAQMLTMRIPDWDPGVNQEKAEQLMQAALHSDTHVLETCHRVAGGGVIPVEVSASSLHHDGRPYVAGYIRDIRDRNRMLEAVRRSNEDLQQFAYVASHDLQEPLRMVASFLQLLERRYGAVLDEDGHEYIRFAVDGAVRMKQLIEDLLAFSRIDTSGAPLAPTSLEQATREACDNLATAITESGASVTWNAPLPQVRGDGFQLVRLMQNLLGNAIKYRSADRKADITVSAVRVGDYWTVSVADNGIGIAPEYHDRIFMIFQRLHGIGAYEGTGIGLAICKRIVERHGGEIWVESQGNTGSTFKFTLKAV